MARRRRRIPDSHAEHPNVVPLIDVMLCIIVFYMLAAKIGVSRGVDPDVLVPVTSLGKEMQEVGTNTIILNVREKLGVPFVTAIVEGGSTLEEVIVEDKQKNTRPLRDMLRAFVIGKDGQPNTEDDNPTLGVIIRGDRDMSYKTFMPVMLSVTDAGVTNIFHNTAKPTAENASEPAR